MGDLLPIIGFTIVETLPDIRHEDFGSHTKVTWESFWGMKCETCGLFARPGFEPLYWIFKAPGGYAHFIVRCLRCGKVEHGDSRWGSYDGPRRPPEPEPIGTSLHHSLRDPFTGDTTVDVLLK